MDYNKIGNFIMTERKSKKLTQAKLAEKLFVSEKTISKWENGNGVPDTDILPNICKIFGISVNELLNGERISKDNYINIAEERLLKLQKAKEEGDKKLLLMEIILGMLSAMFLISFVLLSSLLNIAFWLKIVLIIFAFTISIIGFGFALKIEQVVGFYECKQCKHKYIPTFKQVNLAMHLGRTRYMKCPKCKKKSWCKKVLK